MKFPKGEILVSCIFMLTLSGLYASDHSILPALYTKGINDFTDPKVNDILSNILYRALPQGDMTGTYAQHFS